MASAWKKYNHRAIKQPPYMEDEEATLIRWRSDTTRHVNERISKYSPSRYTQDELVQPARPTPVPASNYKALRIPELLDHILQFADAEAQISAWFVSKEWRKSATSIITGHLFHRFWNSPATRRPVEYDTVVDGNPDIWDPSTCEEVDLFSNTLTQSMQRIHRGTTKDDGRRHRLVARKTLYFPAHYTQASNLPTALSMVLDSFDDTQHGTMENRYGIVHIEPTSHHPNRYWLDFGQFEINPYFTALFPRWLACVNGRIEMTLRSELAGSLLVNPFVSTKAFEFLGPMFLANPPCGVVGIYHNAYTTFLPHEDREYLKISNKELLVRLQNDEGVKLGDIIAALIRHAPRVLASWPEQAPTLREKIATGHWQEDVWRVPGHPRFILLLDSAAMEQE
ncbi:hypothetical protein Ptr902_08521 [Pyrenophora tritici-repentis]|nr:hypothetical protein Ptr902_08521 [Pyrenophora tritici-repentis]